MKRSKAFATAGVVSASLLLTSVAFGANVGLFGLTSHADGPGDLKVVDEAPEEVVEVVDVPVTVPPTPMTAAPQSSNPGPGGGHLPSNHVASTSQYDAPASGEYEDDDDSAPEVEDHDGEDD